MRRGLIFSAIVSFVFNLAPKLRRVIDCLPEQSESCRHDDYQHVAQLSTVKKTGDENRCRDWYCAGDQNLFFARVLSERPPGTAPFVESCSCDLRGGAVARIVPYVRDRMNNLNL